MGEYKLANSEDIQRYLAEQAKKPAIPIQLSSNAIEFLEVVASHRLPDSTPPQPEAKTNNGQATS